METDLHQKAVDARFNSRFTKFVYTDRTFHTHEVWCNEETKNVYKRPLRQAASNGGINAQVWHVPLVVGVLDTRFDSNNQKRR